MVNALYDKTFKQWAKQRDCYWFEMALTFWAPFVVFMLLVFIMNRSLEPFTDAVRTEAWVATLGAAGYWIPYHIQADRT